MGGVGGMDMCAAALGSCCCCRACCRHPLVLHEPAARCSSMHTHPASSLPPPSPHSPPRQQILNADGLDVSDTQTLLFSATLPPWVKDITKRFLKPGFTTADLVGTDKMKVGGSSGAMTAGARQPLAGPIAGWRALAAAAAPAAPAAAANAAAAASAPAAPAAAAAPVKRRSLFPWGACPCPRWM